MSAAWTLTAFAAPPIVTVVAALALRPRRPRPEIVIALNGVVPGAGLAAGGRPTIEVVLGVMFAQTSLILSGGAGEAWMYLPSMAVGAVWAMLHTPLSPLKKLEEADARRLEERWREPATTAAASAQLGAAAASEPASREDADETVIENHYSVEVRCSECGASIPVPVLHHMAHCSFCGSDHLVVGHEDTLYVTLPERVENEHVLREALLDHYRYQRYLKLYRRTVSPLAQQASEVGSTGALIDRKDFDAAAAAAEAAASRSADAYRSKLAQELWVGQTRHFLTPYRHGMGTLYQAAFGRTPRDHEKVLRFAVGTVEVAVSAIRDVELPPMGKLSYLRALHPAVHCADGLKTLPIEGGDGDLERAFGRMDRKRIVRDMQVIRLGSRFTREVTAVVWRPWWIAEVRGPGIDETVLLDGATRSVVGPAPAIADEQLVELPEVARHPGTGLRFVSMECPTCGHEFLFDPDAVLHFCHNCHRVCRVVEGRKRDVGYAHVPPPDEAGWDLVPFWRFPLRLRTGDGQRLTDLMRLKDGIDGTLDQIGDDQPARQHVFYVPAIRCINPRLMATAFNRLFLYAIRFRPPKEMRRFPLETRPRPWTVSLDEGEARNLAPLYLANAFSRRDIARVNVHQVASWLFEAEQEAEGHLMFVPVPQVVTEPFRRHVGRFRDDAVHYVTGRA